MKIISNLKHIKTMKKNESHWRKVLETDYLAGDMLVGREVVTITHYTEDEVYSQQSRGKEKKITLHFKEKKLGMILTKRKAKAISKALGTPLMLEWTGKKITIFAKEEKHFGEYMLVITVETKAPVLPPLVENDSNWNNVKEALKNGFTIDQIKTKYSVSKEIEKILNDGK